MAGVKLEIEVNDEVVRLALERLVEVGGNLEELWQDVGEHLLNTTRERFSAQQDPEGEDWQPLSERYLARKKKNKDKILTLDGYLRSTLAYQVEPHKLLVGTNRVYGATHQLGDEERGIPARPYLGLSEQDKPDIREIIEEHIQDAIGGE